MLFRSTREAEHFIRALRSNFLIDIRNLRLDGSPISGKNQETIRQLILRNERIKELVNKHNNILYAVPYQHFTNSIENYFSMLKSRLQKLDGLTHEKLKENIEKVIKDIPKEKYENIFKGAYNRTEKYVKKPSNRTRKLKNYLP